MSTGSTTAGRTTCPAPGNLRSIWRARLPWREYPVFRSSGRQVSFQPSEFLPNLTEAAESWAIRKRKIRRIGPAASFLAACQAGEEKGESRGIVTRVSDVSAHRAPESPPAGSRAIRPGPLLIIAGAGTGKTNTLAHRVAHLVLSGAKPERILLLTFTRRAAHEMTRRTQQHRRFHVREEPRSWMPPSLVRHVSLDRQSPDPPPCRRRRARCQLQRARPRRCRRFDGRPAPRARLLEIREALPAQRHLPRHLLPSRQHAAAARRDARRALSLVRRMGAAAHRAVSRVCREEARQSGARLRRPAALLARDDERSSGSRPRSAASSITSSSTSTRTRTCCRRRS